MHKPVLLEEVLKYLNPKPGDVVLDATLGSGGHTSAILGRVGPKGLVIGIDQDPEALVRAREKIGWHRNVHLVSSNFKDIDPLLRSMNVQRLDAALFDLGISSEQLESAERGFSFQKEGPLDMRMDASQPLKAADLVNRFPEEALSDLFFRFGEERKSRLIARRIVARRCERPFQTTRDLADTVRSCFRGRHYRIHPATRVFQALRIRVNDELNALTAGLEAAIRWIVAGGRMVVISFHSLEDRIVKERFRKSEREGKIRILTKKVIRPSNEEVARNPRARSARLRAAEKAEADDKNS